jgi:two-component system chemotaxis response regulator CheY
LNILIIDDSVVMRNIHKNILVENKIPQSSFLEAGNGDDALKLAIDHPVGLFLVDWNMPGLNGLEFVKAVRAMEKYRKTPIVMITSEAAKYNVMEAVEAGVTNYIVKPIKDFVLWKKLQPYLEQKEAVG